MSTYPKGVQPEHLKKHAFKPGNNANPKGRPNGARGLAKYIKSKVGNDMHKVADALIDILTGKSKLASTNRDVISAATLLLSYGVGKPLDRIEISAGTNDATELNVEALSDNDLIAFGDWVEKMKADQTELDAPAFDRELH